MNVTVMNRSEATRYCYKHHDNPVVIISISTPGMPYKNSPFKSSANKVRAIMRVWFEDEDRGPGIMTDEDAAKIKRILDQMPDTDIIVHCDAGTSRSAGVAAAILKAKTGSDRAIFNSPKYRPNMHCYRTMLNALCGG